MSILNNIASFFTSSSRSAVGGIHGRLNALRAGFEQDVAKVHAAIETIESGLEADLRAAESRVVAEAASLRALIHGDASPPAPSVAQAPAVATTEAK